MKIGTSFDAVGESKKYVAFHVGTDPAEAFNIAAVAIIVRETLHINEDKDILMVTDADVAENGLASLIFYIGETCDSCDSLPFNVNISVRKALEIMLRILSFSSIQDYLE